MKRLGITQRVDIAAAYGERRDCLDQRWTDLALKLGFLPLPLPNAPPELAADWIDELRLDAIILSGGNSPVALSPQADDAAIERDHFEAALIDAATSRSVPMLGVCRGMQVINLHFGGGLIPIKGHVATRHPLNAAPGYGDIIASDGNSYHNWAIPTDQLGAPLQIMATDADGHIEGFIHTEARIAAIMWHPEREQPPRATDLDLMKKLLQ